jgi:hypothetical protein
VLPAVIVHNTLRVGSPGHTRKVPSKIYSKPGKDNAGDTRLPRYVDRRLYIKGRMTNWEGKPGSQGNRFGNTGEG